MQTSVIVWTSSLLRRYAFAKGDYRLPWFMPLMKFFRFPRRIFHKNIPEKGLDLRANIETPRNITFLVPVWGGRYITEFMQTGLRGLSLPGNLGACTEGAWKVEICFLTTRAGRSVFDADPTLRVISEQITVTYIYIDDLVANANYGVTLTLAFARGIAAKGEEQTKTAFIFLNADFVLADGSLKVVVQMLERGVRGVIAPSLRVAAEDVLPTISSPECEFSCRNLVRLALQNLHPTVIARTLTQNTVSCTEYGQFYWKLGQDCLVGCQHLIFHIMIWPEREMGEVCSYHDYSFVPEMIPSGRFEILNDSDTFTMLELQGRRQEAEMILFRPHDWDRIRAGLCIWTTKEHRQFALTPFVFHSGDINPMQREQARLTRYFVADLHTRLCQPPVSHTDHYYWREGVIAWSSQAMAHRDFTTLPKEVPTRYLQDNSFENRLAYLRELGSEKYIYDNLFQLAGLGSDIFVRYVPQGSGYWQPTEEFVDAESVESWIPNIEAALAQVIDQHSVAAVDTIELAATIPGSGWGPPGGGGANTFRWVAPRTSASLMISFPDIQTQSVAKLYLYTAPEALLTKFEIYVDGVRHDSELIWEVDRFALQFGVDPKAFEQGGRGVPLVIRLADGSRFPRDSVAFSRIKFGG